VQRQIVSKWRVRIDRSSIKLHPVCNSRWYEFMGDTKANPLVPFQMNYVYDAVDEWGIEPWNADAKKCNESYDVSARGMKFLKVFI